MNTEQGDNQDEGNDTEDEMNTSGNANSSQQQQQEDRSFLSYTRPMSDSTRRNLFIAHGILMFLAWGICCPIAIGSSMLRIGITKCIEPKYFDVPPAEDNEITNSNNNANSNNKPLWLRIHTTMNYATVGLTLLAFVLVVVAQKEHDHFHELHHYIGLAVFIGSIVQLTIGFYRVKPAASRSMSLKSVISKRRNRTEVRNSQRRSEKDRLSSSSSVSSSLHCLGITSPPSHYHKDEQQNRTFKPKKLFGSYGGGCLSSDESTAMAEIDSPMSTPLKSKSGSIHGTNSEIGLYDEQPFDEAPSVPSTPATMTKDNGKIDPNHTDDDEVEIVFDHPADERRDGNTVATVTPSPHQKHVNMTTRNNNTTNSNGNESNAANNSNEDDNISNCTSNNETISPKEQRVDIMWRTLHRLLGVILLALAWYNCHIGINLSVEKWADQRDWSGIFWGFIIGIACMVVLLAFVIRCYL